MNMKPVRQREVLGSLCKSWGELSQDQNALEGNRIGVDLENLHIQDLPQTLSRGSWAAHQPPQLPKRVRIIACVARARGSVKLPCVKYLCT